MAAGDDTVFTEHVKQLISGTTSIPEPVWRKLVSRLRTMVRRRGLGQASAATFGYSGKYLGEPETLEELANDAYCHLFYGLGENAGKQFGFLKNQVEAGNEIDPLIQKDLFRFLHDLHRRAFPGDAGIYKNVLAAAKLLVGDPDSQVTARVGNVRKLSLKAVLQMSGDGNDFADLATVERAVRQSDLWHKTLGQVRRFSETATRGVSSGTLDVMQQGTRPLLLQILKDAISTLAYDPAENASMKSQPDFSDEDSNHPEFVRTILDEDRYEVRQAKVDEFVHEGQLAIKQLDCNPITTEKLLEILHCYAEKCRRAAPDDFISQSQVRKDIGLKRESMSQHMKMLRAALETLRP